MNAIYGSNNKEKFLNLQELNDGRFKVNHGIVFIDNKGFDIYKVHSDAEDFKFPKRKKCHTVLGVSHKKTKNFEPEKINPYISDQWIISCYGDFFNHKELIEEFSDGLKMAKNDVLVISHLFEKISLHDDNDVRILKNGLSLIEGHFALWAHNAFSGNSFIAKCNMDIFADIYENTFSTKEFSQSEQLQDGKLYQLTVEGITCVGSFDHFQ